MFIIPHIPECIKSEKFQKSTKFSFFSGRTFISFYIYSFSIYLAFVIWKHFHRFK